MLERVLTIKKHIHQYNKEITMTVTVTPQSSGVLYEVAIEKLGLSIQPIFALINAEKDKPNPSPSALAYYDAKIDLIRDLQDNLRPEETDLIQNILNDDFVF